MFKIIFISIVGLFFLPTTFSQEKLGIKHYERKIEFDSIPLPGDKYSSDNYSIPFPDSLYEYALISIKKLKLSGTKLKAELNMQNKVYGSVSFEVKNGRKKRNFLKHFKDRTNTNLSEKPEQCIEYSGNKIKITYLNMGRKNTYKFEIKDC